MQCSNLFKFDFNWFEKCRQIQPSRIKFNFSSDYKTFLNFRKFRFQLFHENTESLKRIDLDNFMIRLNR